ncbi:hypothetical protein R5R35_009764 [Gryllus longicercus]|uniref:Nuclear RNA export factor 1 n=1 Tax=Gryllus longicercus TaxID=2509291 RepID=A0AAN9W1K4_9ORTH
MPKRNNRAQLNRGSWKQIVWANEEPSRYYYEHDDRGSDTTRRVSILSKNRISKFGNRKRDNDVPGRGRLDDDDVEMAGAAFMAAKAGRYKGYIPKGGPGPSRDRVGPRNRGGRHVQIANGPGSSSYPLQDADKWYKILIPYGGKYEKSYVLRILLSYVSPFVFVPIAYRITNNDVSFYVDDHKAAQILSKANKKITATDGFKLIVKAFPGVPHVSVDDRYKEKLLAAMRGRYNAETKALDLRKFHTDQNLVDDVLVATFRPSVLSVIVDLIAEHIPELVGLNLDENKLFTLEPLVPLAKKTPNLSVLHLGKNRIPNIRRLDCLKGLKLLELFLDGNPMCDKFTEESVYVSEVRKIFPKVIRLDGAVLPPPIVFDVSEEVKLPPYVVSFVCSPEGQQVAKQFLEQYFNIYDSDNRQAIGDAYHENAHFSLAITLPKGDGNHKLNQYMPDNRNLMRVRDANRRMKLLINGKENIISKLKELPLTKHDLASFTVDLPIFNPQLMFLNISGIFIERKLHLPTRYFSRTFVIVPLGGGFVIINDLLNITNATEKQAKAAFTKPIVETPVTSPVATPVVSPVASPPVATASVVPAVPVVPDDVKEQMVVAMCQQTTMNPLWSRKCLEENQWNFNAAVAVFTQLHSEQKVPPEAFVQ